MPALSTLDQAMVPCQCDTSTPSAYANVEAASAATAVPTTATLRLVRRAAAKVCANKGSPPRVGSARLRRPTGHDHDVPVAAVPHGLLGVLGAVEGDHQPAPVLSAEQLRVWDVRRVRRIEPSLAVHGEVEHRVVASVAVAGQEPPPVVDVREDRSLALVQVLGGADLGQPLPR